MHDIIGDPRSMHASVGDEVRCHVPRSTLHRGNGVEGGSLEWHLLPETPRKLGVLRDSKASVAQRTGDGLHQLIRHGAIQDVRPRQTLILSCEMQNRVRSASTPFTDRVSAKSRLTEAGTAETFS